MNLLYIVDAHFRIKDYSSIVLFFSRQRITSSPPTTTLPFETNQRMTMTTTSTRNSNTHKKKKNNNNNDNNHNHTIPSQTMIPTKLPSTNNDGIRGNQETKKPILPVGSRYESSSTLVSSKRRKKKETRTKIPNHPSTGTNNNDACTNKDHPEENTSSFQQDTKKKKSKQWLSKETNYNSIPDAMVETNQQERVINTDPCTRTGIESQPTADKRLKATTTTTTTTKVTLKKRKRSKSKKHKQKQKRQEELTKDSSPVQENSPAEYSHQGKKESRKRKRQKILAETSEMDMPAGDDDDDEKIDPSTTTTSLEGCIVQDQMILIDRSCSKVYSGLERMENGDLLLIGKLDKKGKVILNADRKTDSGSGTFF